MSPEIGRISDQLERAVDGPAWHGPPVSEILKDVDARTAAAHPVGNAHSIWELLNHMTAWTRAVVRRMNGQAVELEGDANFPPVKDPSEPAWKAAMVDFRTAQTELLQQLKSFPAERLGDIVPGRKYTHLVQFDGLIQHHLYHAGQMALLKKARAFR